MKKTHLHIGATLLVAVLFGFVLEMVKVNINYVLETSAKIPDYFSYSLDDRKSKMDALKIEAPYDYYHNHRRIEKLFSMSQSQLENLKWGITLLGTIAFLIIHILLVYWVTKEKKIVRWTLILYAFFFCLSFAIFLFGRFTGTLEYAYGVSRKIAGALQSLVPIMLIIPGWWVWKRTQIITTSKDEVNQ